MDDAATSTTPRASEWERNPADVARLVFGLLVLAASLLTVAVYPSVVKGISEDLVALVLHVPRGVRSVLLGATQLAAVGAPIAVFGTLLARRRFKLAGVAAAAAAVAGATMALLQGWVDETVPAEVISMGDRSSWVSGAAFPSGAYLAAFTAVVVVLTPLTGPSWRRAAWIAIAVGVFCRIVTAVTVPVTVVVTVAVGLAVGSAIVVAFGAPRRHYSLAEVEAGVRRAGVRVGAIRPLDLHGTRRLFATSAATTADPVERPAVITLIGSDDRNADLLLRALRWVRTKGIDESRLSWRPGAKVEHEAFALLLASEVATTPDLLGVAETPDGDGILVVSEPVGVPVVDLTPDRLSDAALDSVWEQVAALQGRRLAHRSLHGGNVRITDHGTALIDGFERAVPGADDRELKADLAEVLVSLATVVGTDRAVAAAVRSPLPVDDLTATLPLLQLAALSAETRRRVGRKKQDRKLVDDVRVGLQEAIGAEEVELAEIARISRTQVVTTFGIVLLVLAVLAVASNAADVGDALGEMDLTYVPLILLTVVVSYLGGTWSLLGAVSTPLPFWRTAEVMLAQTVLNRFTPANAGGMALRARYLQKHGADLTLAATSVGLTSAASGVVQVVLLVVLFVWAGSTGSLGISLPGTNTVALVLLVIAVLAGIVYLTPWGRRVVLTRAKDVIGKAVGELRTLAGQPSKLVALFGGALIGKITSIVAFQASCQAFGVYFSLPRAALLFMTANTIASVAPTPGGIGAVEAALVAALTSADVETAVALSIVLVYRLLTFWVPVLPSWVALGHLRRIDAV